MFELGAVNAPRFEVCHQLRMLLVQRVECTDCRVDGTQQVL